MYALSEIELTVPRPYSCLHVCTIWGRVNWLRRYSCLPVCTIWGRVNCSSSILVFTGIHYLRSSWLFLVHTRVYLYTLSEVELTVPRPYSCLPVYTIWGRVNCSSSILGFALSEVELTVPRPYSCLHVCTIWGRVNCSSSILVFTCMYYLRSS